MDLEVFYAVDDEIESSADSSGVAPMTAQEYLRQVALDRRRHDEISIAKCKPPTTSSHKAAATRDGGEPTGSNNAGVAAPAEWRHQVLADFTELRARLHRQRSVLARADGLPKGDWPAYCVASEWRRYCLDEGRYPQLKHMLAMPYDVYIDALAHIAEWLEGGEEPVERVFPWLFAVLAVMEKPLDPDHQAYLRQVARACKTIRGALPLATDNEILRRRCTFFVCIIANYFGQYDLAD